MRRATSVWSRMVGARVIRLAPAGRLGYMRWERVTSDDEGSLMSCSGRATAHQQVPRERESEAPEATEDQGEAMGTDEAPRGDITCRPISPVGTEGPTEERATILLPLNSSCRGDDIGANVFHNVPQVAGLAQEPGHGRAWRHWPRCPSFVCHLLPAPLPYRPCRFSK